MKSIFNQFVIAISILTASLSGHAITVSGIVTVEGCHATDSQCFIALDSTASSGCAYGLIYYDMNVAGSKGLKASALAAKMGRRSVSIDYSKGADSVCRLNYLYQNP
jgi:hypothetical protein